jgi:hypothetical protein
MRTRAPVAQVASAATAYEVSAPYCRHLEKRSAGAYRVACTDYRRATGLDADIVTWWAEEPVLKNGGVLRELLRLQAAGQLRSTAEAILVFDPQWPPDLRDWQKLRAAASPSSSWSQTVRFNETAQCYASSDSRLRRRRSLCRRAVGVFHVLGLRIADYRPGVAHTR